MITLDPQFGSRYVTKYEDHDYDYGDGGGGHHGAYGPYGGGGHHGAGPRERPLESLITNKELVRRMTFEYKQCSTEVGGTEFAGWQQGHGGQCRSDFWRYNIRGDWFTIAFGFDENEDKFPPRWVTLISTGNRQIFECRRSG